MNPRITIDPEVCSGEPCIRETRIPVHVILSHLAAGEDEKTLLKNFPNITHQDILACLEYASFVTTEKVTTL
ncbi:MAG: antitoxin [bacterium (Candidatus Ratteibacteria) CG_4_10_14_3_um_filter_41_18]|uniref:Antitoxin n=3 Tax=Candidatus Ratteibacteria TaxID=2979319 RepID=A0A2M7YHM4_9BACT|nr:MAG: antitoxin [bacterium (Candidatus Ratteibacteria) CG15_BIG_FIL_POST_REV_8_21_14_020_41_12]PIX77147.1 MAG: antitoxin [bacterium (Candidatus Ratteibacteria) CG_4_10_14_3_um_filter_41_18]PJA62468.1 MAG: antitoxin [bacterium (Candidatus Ratteibacteria) CG_4_9_14_3_um_filter_41_21]